MLRFEIPGFYRTNSGIKVAAGNRAQAKGLPEAGSINKSLQYALDPQAAWLVGD